MLLLILLTCCCAAGGALGDEELPPEQMYQFMKDVLFEARAGLVSRRALGEVDWRVSHVFLGLPIELALVSHNTSLIGPTTLQPYSSVIGEQFSSGSASILTTIDIGQLKVEYSYLLIDIFGLKYEGAAQLEVLEPRVNLTIHIYRNVLTACQVSTNVARPSGMVVATLGEDGGALHFLMSLLGSFLSKTVLPAWLLDWAFFPDISVQLREIIQEAATKVACK